MPSSARAIITSKTSLIISGSSAEVGSSNNIIFGFIASERAIATLCCCPPDNCPGYLLACSGILTFSKCCIANSSASFLGIFLTHIGARETFSLTDKCGNKLNC